jgi:hypothetical protein
MNARSRRALAVVLLSSAFVSACGLKPEVKDSLSIAGGSSGGSSLAGGDGATGTEGLGADLDGDGVVDPGTVDAGTGTAGGGTTDAGTTGGAAGTTAGGDTGGGTAGGDTGGGTAAAPAAPAEGKGNTTGIDFQKKTIKIVLHGPLTGAGVPQESFRTGGPKYWDKSGPGGGPRLVAGGFRVIAEAVDDKYNAQDALRACNAAASSAFLIMGGAGTDQIQACAQSQVLQRGNVPYLSSGVTEAGLGALKHYFATSLTYKQQSPLIIQMARDNGFLNKKWAIVITGTPNFADARDSMIAELQKAGVNGKNGKFNAKEDVYLTDKAPANCVDIGTKLRSGGYESVYFIGQPLFFGQCVNQYPTPVYTGAGPSFGIQSVADLACRGGASAYRGFYLHPSPDKNMAQSKAPGAPPFTDDIEAGIWGGMQQLEQAFNSVKGPLSRESFIAAVAAGGSPGGVLPPAQFNGKTRFGGTAAYANKITCRGTSGVIQTVKLYSK